MVIEISSALGKERLLSLLPKWNSTSPSTPFFVCMHPSFDVFSAALPMRTVDTKQPNNVLVRSVYERVSGVCYPGPVDDRN
jgi:hypothetical protein